MLLIKLETDVEDRQMASSMVSWPAYMANCHGEKWLRLRTTMRVE